MEFKEGVKVMRANGERAGSLSRVVIDPRSKDVTYIAVKRGFLAEEEKVLPIRAIAQADEQEIWLAPEVKELDDYPDFVETDYVSLEGEMLPSQDDSGHGWQGEVYSYPKIYPTEEWGLAGGAMPPYYIPGQGYTPVSKHNVPEGSIALDQGTRVTTTDGEHVGDLDEVITGGPDEMASHIVLSRGLLGTQKKLIPADWIMTVEEDQIRLAVPSKVVKNLPAYQKKK